MSNTLKFANTGPQLSHIIKDHPKETAVEEAVRNMIEATLAWLNNHKQKEAKIYIRKLDIASGLIRWDENNKQFNYFKNKLSFLNPGGMSMQELSTAFCQIGSSVGKENSLDRNYGQGIRTSVLFWSDLLCITYKNGVAHYVWLGKEELGGNDFEIAIHSADGTYKVQECTDWVKENAESRGYNLNEDFTEVIILGREANQDTFSHPFHPSNKQPGNWIQRSIYSRFWNIPSNIKLMLHKDVRNSSGKGYQNFMTFKQCFEAEENKGRTKLRKQICKIQAGQYCGARIHYYYDAPDDNGNVSTYLKANDYGWSGGNVSSIVINNEMYDVKNHSSSEQSSLIKLGIHKNHRHFKIIFELPQDAGYTYNMYRTHVLRGQDPILFDDEDVLLDIKEYMPEWFEDLVNETKIASKVDIMDEIKKRLQAQKDLFNPMKGNILTKKGNAQGGGSNKSSASGSKKSGKNKGGTLPKGNNSGQMVLPEIIPNPSVTEPFFAKVEGTSASPILFTNPDWKHLDALALQISKGEKDIWYHKAKKLLEDEFSISSVMWWANALSQNNNGNITADEFADTISHRSINMYLMAINTIVFDAVDIQIKREMAMIDKEIPKREEVVA